MAFVASLEARGIETKVLKADVGSPKDVKSLISELRAARTPLKGLVHLAMVIDACLPYRDRDVLDRIIEPKGRDALMARYHRVVGAAIAHGSLTPLVSSRRRDLPL